MLKNKKRKIYIYILSGVALIGLISVGFSSWIIDKIQGAKVEDISVTIGDIDDSSLRIELIEEESDLNQIRFDSLSADHCDGGVITNGGDGVEKMSFTITYTLTSGSGFSTENKIKVDYTFGGQAKEYYISKLGGSAGFIDTTCIEKSYSITGIDGTTTSITDVPGENKLVAVKSTITYSPNTNSAKITSTFNFGWGYKFEYKNPCLSSKGSIMDTLKAFETAYNGIKEISGDTSINVTITPAFEKTTN